MFGCFDPKNKQEDDETEPSGKSHALVSHYCAAGATFRTAKDRRVGMEALFKQVVKSRQIDLFWHILGESKGGLYWYRLEIKITDQEQNLGQ